MSDIPSFPYRILWEERQLVSVANLTRRDGIEFLAIAPKAGRAELRRSATRSAPRMKPWRISPRKGGSKGPPSAAP